MTTVQMAGFQEWNNLLVGNNGRVIVQENGAQWHRSVALVLIGLHDLKLTGYRWLSVEEVQ